VNWAALDLDVCLAGERLVKALGGPRHVGGVDAERRQDSAEAPVVERQALGIGETGGQRQAVGVRPPSRPLEQVVDESVAVTARPRTIRGRERGVDAAIPAA
jgi:hypothetical protein